MVGLEGSGTTDETGERGCGLLGGGGHAEYVAAPVGQVFPAPQGQDLVTAAGIPEAYVTAFVNLTVQGGPPRGATLLVHASAPGVGLASIHAGKFPGTLVTGST